MFDYIYEWVRNIACYMVLVTAFIQIVPGNDYKKYIRFFTGIILIILLMTPVLKLLGMGSGFWDIYEGKAYEEQRREMEEAAELWNNLEISEYVADPEKSTEEDDIQIEVGEISIGH
ncbi:MAG: stage III sporulation protein AF [Dorea sp.]|mgnify:FL=1|nr:stage III sporulation protein AF [Faecalimonas umbilicata]